MASPRWATWSPRSSAGRPAPTSRFMNPGGLRADMLGTAGRPARPDLPAGRRRPAVRQHPGEHGPHRCPDQDDPRAAVAARRRRQHPVAPVPAARHLRGLHLDLRRRPAPEGDRITGMWLDGEPIDLDETYRVAATRSSRPVGDNFWGFDDGDRQAGHRQDRPAGHGRLHGASSATDATPLPVDYRQHAVGVTLPGRRAGDVRRRRHVWLRRLSSLAMTGCRRPAGHRGRGAAR